MSLYSACKWCGDKFPASSASGSSLFCSKKCLAADKENRQKEKQRTSTPSSGKSILGTLFSLIFKK